MAVTTSEFLKCCSRKKRPQPCLGGHVDGKRLPKATSCSIPSQYHESLSFKFMQVEYLRTVLNSSSVLWGIDESPCNSSRPTEESLSGEFSCLSRSLSPMALNMITYHEYFMSTPTSRGSPPGRKTSLLSVSVPLIVVRETYTIESELRARFQATEFSLAYRI